MPSYSMAHGDYDRSELEASGCVWVTDANYSTKDFIEPLGRHTERLQRKMIIAIFMMVRILKQVRP